MAKLVICNTTAQSFTLSNTVYRAISNVVAVQSGSVSNTLLENAVALYITEGLRRVMDNGIMGEGQKGDAGLSVTYLEGNLRSNNE